MKQIYELRFTMADLNQLIVQEVAMGLVVDVPAHQLGSVGCERFAHILRFNVAICARAIGQAAMSFEGGLLFRRGLGSRRQVLAIGHVTVDGGDDLAKVAFADGVFGVVLGVGQCRKQQGRKDRDDGDDH